MEGILNTTRRVLFKLLQRAVAKCGQGAMQGGVVQGVPGAVQAAAEGVVQGPVQGTVRVVWRVLSRCSVSGVRRLLCISSLLWTLLYRGQ